MREKQQSRHAPSSPLCTDDPACDDGLSSVNCVLPSVTYARDTTG
jgi:hypothetical protein